MGTGNVTRCACEWLLNTDACSRIPTSPAPAHIRRYVALSLHSFSHSIHINVSSGGYVIIDKHFGLVYLFRRVLEGNKTTLKVAEAATTTRGDSLFALDSKYKSFGSLLAGASVASNREHKGYIHVHSDMSLQMVCGLIGRETY